MAAMTFEQFCHTAKVESIILEYKKVIKQPVAYLGYESNLLIRKVFCLMIITDV